MSQTRGGAEIHFQLTVATEPKTYALYKMTDFPVQKAYTNLIPSTDVVVPTSEYDFSVSFINFQFGVENLNPVIITGNIVI